MTTLTFAQISDIHISALGDHDEMLSGQAAEFLTKIVAGLKAMEDLAFVLFTGDLFDTASYQELDRFQTAVKLLPKPYFVIPGNHDRRPPESSEGLTRHQFARYFNPQVEARPTASEAQVGYWSIGLNPKVQLIGLDSVRDEDWDGVIDTLQLEWLRHELGTHRDKLVILAVHHPLHRLAPIDDLPRWKKFVCNNGPEVIALLDDNPQVKIVLTGHHHLTKVDRMGPRIHFACPAVALYPCAYRTLRLSQQDGHTWHLTWQTVPAADEKAIAKACHQMLTTWTNQGFEPDFIETHLKLAWGSENDRHGQAVLSGLENRDSR